MKKYSLCILAFIFVTACRKPGLGGGNIIDVYPQHHGDPIFGDTIYIKFDSKEFPGFNPSDYDMRVIGEVSENHCYINGLKPGSYYLFAKGWDPIFKESVKGGIPISLMKKQEKITLIIPVTE